MHDQVGLACLSSLLLPLRDLPYALVDDSRGGGPHLDSLILERFKDDSVVLFLSEQFVECYHGLLSAELAQNEDS